MVSKTFPDADRAGQERLTAWFVYGSAPFEHNHEAAALVPEIRKPFDVLAEGLISKNNRELSRPIGLFLRGVAEWEPHVVRLVLAA
jgi:hypothetical protein